METYFLDINKYVSLFILHLFNILNLCLDISYIYVRIHIPLKALNNLQKRFFSTVSINLLHCKLFYSR